MKKTIKEQIPAIIKSRNHWIRLRDGKNKPGEGAYADDCALCKINTHEGGEADCGSCALGRKLGPCGIGAGNPWRNANLAFSTTIDTSSWPSTVVRLYQMGRYHAMNKMVEALNSLLPKKLRKE